MNRVLCYKMTGSGNDFVFVDGRAAPVEQWDASRIREICTRGTGVGADGFVVLGPGSGKGRVRFNFFNSDGARAAMCGNGALCATRLAANLGLAPPEDMQLETDAGVYSACCVGGSRDRATLRLPDVTSVSQPTIRLTAGEHSIHFVDMGVQHLVVVAHDAKRVNLSERGRELRNHPALGPGGANVNFVSASQGRWTMRTYERGVEGETLACGTGAVATATVLATAGQISLPWRVETASGKELLIDGRVLRREAVLEAPTLTGEARQVFHAILS